MPSAIESAVLEQLVARNAVQSAAWGEVTSDYLAVLQRSRELQARRVVGAASVPSTARRLPP